jgi:alanyl-tRNA synthetase
LGELKSTADFKGQKINWQDLEAIENRTNELIRQCLPFKVIEKHPNDESIKHLMTQDPDKIVGDVIRLIEIEGIDVNPCCGTHVKNSSELQIVKFIDMEKIRGGCTRVQFLVGQRAIKHFQQLSSIDLKLRQILSVKNTEYETTIINLQNRLKDQSKQQINIYKELISNMFHLWCLNDNQDKSSFTLFFDNQMETFIQNELVKMVSNLFKNNFEKYSKTSFIGFIRKDDKNGSIMFYNHNPKVLLKINEEIGRNATFKGSIRGSSLQGKVINWMKKEQLEMFIKGIVIV